MSQKKNKRWEELPLPAPNAEGNIWPKQVCPAFMSRDDTPAGIRQCWYCCHAEFHLGKERALEIGVCYWPKTILR